MLCCVPIRFANKHSRMNQLFPLAEKDELELLQESLAGSLSDAGPGVIREKSRDTLLHCACRGGAMRCLAWLVDQQPQLMNARNAQDRTPLHECCASKKEDFSPPVELLLRAGADPLMAKPNGWTCLHSACEKGFLNIVKCIISICQEKSIHVLPLVNKEGSSAFHIAVRNGTEEVVRVLLEAGADFECPNKNLRRPVHAAAMNGSVKVLSMLKSAGAKFYEKDSSGSTVWHEASAFGNLDALRWLINNISAVPEASSSFGRDNNGRHPLHSACREGKDAIVKELCKHLSLGFSIRDIDDATPMMLACVQGHHLCVLALLEAGANPSETNQHGHSALSLSKNWKRKQCDELLQHWKRI